MELGIDDPVAWMNAVPPQVVDQWIAYFVLGNDEQAESKPAEQWRGGIKSLNG